MTVHPFRRRALAVGALIAVTLGSAAPATAASGAAPPTAPPTAPKPAPTASGGSRTITLINGDKVTVAAVGGVTTTAVHDPNGRPVGAQVVTVGKDTYVYPDAVAPYIGAGLLDEQLFNVTQLIADGYDDAKVDRLPLIVSYTDEAARAKSTSLPEGAVPVRPLTSVGGAAIEQRRDQAEEFWTALTGGASAERRKASGVPSFTGGIAKVWLDGKVHATLADSTAQIGAPAVWSSGNTGEGVPVAVLDTGVDAEHPDLAGQLDATRSFVPDEDVIDRVGHGTHVASTIAGTGAASDGKERGVAPGARLHIGKVLNNAGEGQDSWIIAGMEWAAREEHAKVISMSLGSGPTDGTDPKSEAVNRLSAETGALFTVAAGNSGPDMQSVASPGTADAALTVGAVDSLDRLAVFSSRGPRRGDNGLKPEITAPGVGVVAARSQYAQEGEGPYLTMDGTSMATPHVAGAAALLAAQHPDWNGQQLKDALLSTSKITRQYDAYWAGSGRVDVAAAASATVFATGVDFTGLRWPYTPGQKVEKEIVYTNTGDAPVTLDLAVNAPTAPEGLFTLSASQVTVPAHGTDKVTVTVNLDSADDDTYANGSVVATGPDGTPMVHTLVGMNKEGRRIGLSVRTKDRDGSGLPGDILVKEITHDTAPKLYSIDESGQLDLQLPPGTYSLLMYADVEGVHGPSSLGRAALVAPEVVLADADQTVTLNAADLRQAKAITPKEAATEEFRVDYHRSYPDMYPLNDNYIIGHEYDSVWVTPTKKKVSQGTFGLGVRWSMVEPPLTLSGNGDDYDDFRLQAGSAYPAEGKNKEQTAFAGNGTPAEFAQAKVRDKVAVVRHNADVPATEQADAAAAAGAKLLVIVNDGLGRLDAWLEVEDAKTPLPVVSLGRDQGEKLISQLARGRDKFTVESHPAPDYVYDLVQRYEGTIPSKLTYEPSSRDLARVDVDFRNPVAGDGVFMRYDISPLQPGNALGGAIVPITTQGTRTDWLGGSDQWMESAVALPITEASDVLTYQAGKKAETTWFGPVIRPRLLQQNINAGVPVIYGDYLTAYTMPSWGDADPRHSGIAWDGEISWVAGLYQGDQLISEGLGGSVEGTLTPGPTPVRLVLTTTQKVDISPYSPQTRTEWTFGFTKVEETPQQPPLIQLDYGVDTDLAGTAKRHSDIEVTASHLKNANGAGKIRDIGLELSYDDGATWQKADKPKEKDGVWRFTMKAPKSARFATLRTTAQDASGNTVTQTVTRAFGLR
ncbi:Serine protease, subtilisin family [Nonomuraea maritima]|uniref:Serine protease, subtilisin family n=1 Tax=Nonomuraea maritima TaxID=683260 RepID=A0A1G9RP22_9ACTN|nr:S8 family serine peptidase [Nonomuraea maritima]SDM24942.1 Serine protease, subtilisin family [Nonomuraea maritima]